jgi:dihydrofolate synthase / folylpolyglutamate synthase
MNYEEVLEYILKALPMFQQVGSIAYKADLENAYALDELAGYPHKHFKTIHVAGTNGKGSVSHMLASILQHAGYKTGLFTSPHLMDFRERIKVDGVPVTKEFVKKYIERNMPFFDKIKPSFFEMSVFMAFCYFKINKVDIAIIETGLGGRLDTTNIITPILSVITNIGNDHTQILGKTIKDIAKEKAGIIKPQVPVVIGETHEISSQVFNARSCLMESPIYYADQEIGFDFSLRTPENTMKYNFIQDKRKIEIETDLLGNYQNKNLRTCLKALDIAREKIKIPQEAILEGLKTIRKTTGLAGRWQEVAHNPLTICDVAHNKEGLLETLHQIANTPHRDLHFVLGFVNDKNLEEILPLFPKKANYYFTKISVARTAFPADYAPLAKNLGLDALLFESVAAAYCYAYSVSKPEDMIYIGGSTFVVADYLAYEKRKNAV